MSDAPDALGLIAPEQRPPPVPGGGPQTVAGLLEPGVARCPERTALAGRHGRYSYAELDREVDRAVCALVALGIEPGDRVAACLPNDVDIVIAFLATQRRGAIWVGINRPLAPAEKAYMLADCAARLLLADPEMLDPLRPLLTDLDELEHVLFVDHERPREGWLDRLASVPAGQRPPAVEIDPCTPAAIAYTSGTTGYPKGAVHSQRNLLLPGAVIVASGQHAEDSVHGMVLPLTILNIFVRSLIPAYTGLRKAVCIDRVDPVGLAEWVREEGVVTIDAVPTIYRDLLTHPDVKPEDLESMREPIMGGADCPPETIALYRERFGREVTIGYGMTEAPTAVSWSDGEIPPAPGLCGRAVPQVEIRIVDEDDRPLPPGEVGEICVAPATTGPYAGMYTPMLGYWGKPEATREALRGGMYHTGDVGLLEADGNLYIRGRRNELILRGGANVYPAEVERVLGEHPAVQAAAVLGVPDERLGERVVAAVQLQPGASAGSEELREHVRSTLARYKVPDAIRRVESLPRNAMQKVIKRELLPLFDDLEVLAKGGAR